MWARSPLNKLLLGALLGCLCQGALARDGEADPLARYRTQSGSHGLYEIREAARAFLTQESAKQHKTLQPMDPSLQIVVPRCLVPLTVRWADKALNDNQPGVDVVCKQSVNKQFDHSWDVFVPLFEPEIAAKWRALEEKNRRNAPAAKGK